MVHIAVLPSACVAGLLRARRRAEMPLQKVEDLAPAVRRLRLPVRGPVVVEKAVPRARVHVELVAHAAPGQLPLVLRDLFRREAAVLLALWLGNKGDSASVL
jgi:hypothetical protein